MSKITLSVTLDHRLARSLGSYSTGNFVVQQPDRFSVMDLDGVDDVLHDDVAPLLGADFAGGTMTWLGTLTEALLLRAYEQAAGYRTAILSDEACACVPMSGPGGGYEDSYVVLSSRCFNDGWGGGDGC